MKNKLFFGVVTGMFLATLIFSMYFLLIKNVTLFMSSFVLCVLFFISAVNYASFSKNDTEKYDEYINRIIRKHKDIMVKSLNYPDLLDKDIMKLDSIEDLLNAQMQIDKPIYYIKQALTCSFILIDNGEALVYIAKKSNDVVSALDIIIRDVGIIRKQERRKNKSSDELLSDIDKTTVVKVNDDKKFKVSPVKKNKVEKDVK